MGGVSCAFGAAGVLGRCQRGVTRDARLTRHGRHHARPPGRRNMYLFPHGFQSIRRRCAAYTVLMCYICNVSSALKYMAAETPHAAPALPLAVASGSALRFALEARRTVSYSSGVVRPSPSLHAVSPPRVCAPRPSTSVYACVLLRAGRPHMVRASACAARAVP